MRTFSKRHRCSQLAFLMGVIVWSSVGNVMCSASVARLRLPRFQKTKIGNNLTLLLMEQHEVPIVSIQVLVKTGSTADPTGKEGLASLTSDLLRKGTKTRSANQIASDLDLIGGLFETETRWDYTRITAEFTRKDFQAGLALLVELLCRPDFPEAEVEKQAARQIDAIRSRKDRVRSVIGEYFNRFVYGTHSYGRPVGGDELSLSRIIREDVARFHARHYVPGNCIVAVVGDFANEKMEAILKDQLGSWRGENPPELQLAAARSVDGRRLLLVDKPDASQTYFQIGNIEMDRSNPDRVYVQVVNTLLGGRFTSMLNTGLRINSGLSYGAYSRFDMRKLPGIFVVSSSTRSETTGEALDLTLKILDRLHSRGVTREALESAKQYIKGQFPLTIETSDALAALLAELEFYGLDATEVDNLYDRMDSMTVADADRVIRQYFPLENLCFVLIGRSEIIVQIAKRYGTQVETRSISQPGF